MLESSLSISNEVNSKRNLITNFSSNSPENFIRDEINEIQAGFAYHRRNNLDTSNNQEFQNFVNQMILNLVAKTEAELNMISTITQQYKEAASSTIN
ncbi:hypothetical protein [Pleurocapsa sp. PCC 7319]|uniref:hypothetical protein n=1 Tax=Pleurocapsa sp. PCC 7319 TaxID=118161 RepID=UPI000347B515|nr:hypothetical protein [Pleurocapsa sp. PCC 7319]